MHQWKKKKKKTLAYYNQSQIFYFARMTVTLDIILKLHRCALSFSSPRAVNVQGVADSQSLILPYQS